MWDECNCVVIWTFFGTVFLCDRNENWPFPILWLLLSFLNFWHIECSTFTASSFRIWSSSTGIPLPPLVLLIVMLSKAYLTSHSRTSDSRWLITPLCLSGSWRSFLHSSSVYSCHLFLISSASVSSIPFLFFIVLIFAWNILLLSLIFLKKSLVFPILLFFLFSSLRKAFLPLLAILWNSAFKCSNGCYFPFPFAFSFSSQAFVRTH